MISAKEAAAVIPQIINERDYQLAAKTLGITVGIIYGIGLVTALVIWAVVGHL